ncbi:hypothetical protein [Paenibacillus sp. WC2504]|uniref:hypothetical protein n=1 Tax=Paenibacillus sp. WC2504 TaxID=3461403 RepID=UPI0040456A51
MSIIQEDSDFLHEVIFRLDNKIQDVKFPINRVSEYLVSEGYIVDSVLNNSRDATLFKDGKKVLVSNNAICFEKIDSTEKEKYKQKFFTYIISRSKIFFQSVLQNEKSSRINLIQNQLRTCVSNMYYTLHNSFASMVEYYKAEYLINQDLKEIWNKNDDEETMLGHFVPDALKVTLKKMKIIIESDKESCLQGDTLKSGKLKSYQNPFSWINPIFFDWYDQEDFKLLIESMADALKNIYMENIGVDETHKRSNFERQLKDALLEVQEIINNKEKSSREYIIATLSGFLGYAYMLRQLGDYDSLFEMKTSQKDIINWTIITSNFVNLVIKYLNEKNEESINRVQKLDAVSSTEILQSIDIETDTLIMTMTGIIIDNEFNMIDLIKKLYSQQGYKILDHKGKVPRLTDETNEITIRREFPGTTLVCYISFSIQGMFRIDVLNPNSNGRFRDSVNLFYLEKLIDHEVIERDLLLSVSDKAIVVRGIPTTHGSDNTYKYIDILLGVHPMIERQISSSVFRQMDTFAEMFSDESISILNYFNSNLDVVLLDSRVRYVIRRISHEDIGKKVLLNLFIANNFDRTNEIKNKVIKEQLSRHPDIELIIEYIYLSEAEIRQFIEMKNYNRIKSQVEELKIKHTLPSVNESIESNVDDPEACNAVVVDELDLSIMETAASES